jgi:hypothetical protein
MGGKMATRRRLKVVEDQLAPEEEIEDVAPKLKYWKERQDEAKKEYESYRKRFFALLTAVTGKDGKAIYEAADGFVYGRDIAMSGAGVVDVDAFMEDQPELAEFIVDEEIVYVFNEGKAMKWIDKHPEDVALIQQYVSEGTPQPRLAKIRPVSDE